jgi:spermidine synthase
MTARSISAGVDSERRQANRKKPRRTPKRILFAAAFVVGFAFLLMELVWYRMLGPLLGGSTFTFGLILAIALLGIGRRRGVRAGARHRRATPAASRSPARSRRRFLDLPFALGDRLAISQLPARLGNARLRRLRRRLDDHHAIVVLSRRRRRRRAVPAADLAARHGQDDVGRHVGSRTRGTPRAQSPARSRAASDAAALTAPGTWKLASCCSRHRRSRCATGRAALFAAAPSPPHSPSDRPRSGATPASAPGAPGAERLAQRIREWENASGRELVWERGRPREQRRLIDPTTIAFVVNGKSDGSARGDAGTQVMAGLVGAMLHPDPRSALVIGLGTGSTAGWLGAVPSMERVDVVELEPAVLRVAEDCAPVNHDVLHNPKVHIRIGDAREVLLATRNRYDIIFSEPSNPYRAGIASLFTREFYEAPRRRA